MKFHEILESKLYEDLQLVKFKYANFKKDPNPKVKVLDFEYPGRPGQKTYGQRKDLLGFNLNYFKNSRYASRAIDEIDGFARLLSADKKEKYERLKYFYPDVLKFIRRYNRDHISGMKRKGRIFYRSTDYEDLIKKDKDSF
jgi:hypothetical protein